MIGRVGLWPMAALFDMRDETWDLVIAQNLTATMYCLRAELAEIQPGGSIVCVSALLGQNATGMEVAYSVCKVSSYRISQLQWLGTHFRLAWCCWPCTLRRG